MNATQIRSGERRPRILLVDDDPMNIRVLYAALSDECEALMATNGEMALALCERESPDLVLLDVVMPGLDGLEVCRRIKANPVTAATPVIFVSAQNAADQENAGLEAGAADFVTKPINPGIVRVRVRTQLRLKRQAALLRSLGMDAT